MRQAIVTKYLGPTDSRGSRVKATADAGSITVPWDDRLDVNANHDRAAVALAKKVGWSGTLLGGGLPRGMGGNVYVWAPRVEHLNLTLSKARIAVKAGLLPEALELLSLALTAELFDAGIEVLP